MGSQGTSPFLPLASLLFSEKKPGDLASRQLLVELIGTLFTVCPDNVELPLQIEQWTDEMVIVGTGTPRESTAGDGAGKRYTRILRTGDDAGTSDARSSRAHQFVNALMLGPGNEKERQKVDFIQDTHRARIYKPWVKEIGDCCRDYFWCV